MNHTDKILNVLLVEDDASDIRMFKDAIKESTHPWKLSTVPDGEEAILFLRRKGKYADSPRPNLIILDLNMPKKDGREVLSEIKGDDGLKKIPVIVLTTSSSDKDIQISYELQASSFITKPRERRAFISMIKDLEHFWEKIATPPNGTL